MQACDSREDFAHAPIGRCFAGRSFLVWVSRPDSAGLCFDGDLDTSDLTLLDRLVEAARGLACSEEEGRLAVVVDFERVRAPSPAVLEEVARVLLRYAELGRLLRRVAVVRPAGTLGAMLAGVIDEYVGGRTNVALFVDRTEAFAWALGAQGAIDSLAVERALSRRLRLSVLGALRAYLEATLRSATVEEAARRMGTSTRSLQRRLLAAGTSFSSELTAARIRAAERLLAETDAGIASVAADAGFSSSTHFCTTFRQRTGRTPSQFRALASRAEHQSVDSPH
jgi:AraC-like DNA-binding protein